MGDSAVASDQNSDHFFDLGGDPADPPGQFEIDYLVRICPARFGALELGANARWE